MTEFSDGENGRKAAKEYFSKIKNLYERHRRDPDNPDEYVGLDEKEKEIKRCMIEEKNRILMQRIEDYVEDSHSGKPIKCMYIGMENIDSI